MTCVLTALTTIGASRQKQVLRIIGATPPSLKEWGWASGSAAALSRAITGVCRFIQLWTRRDLHDHSSSIESSPGMNGPKPLSSYWAWLSPNRDWLLRLALL